MEVGNKSKRKRRLTLKRLTDGQGSRNVQTNLTECVRGQDRNSRDRTGENEWSLKAQREKREKKEGKS